MRNGIFIPLIDLAFLSLAAVVAMLSQTQLIESLPVEVTRIEPGIAAISRDDVTVITITAFGLQIDGRPTSLAAIGGEVRGRLALLRVDRNVPTEVLVQVMGELAAHEVELRIEVQEQARS